MFIYIHTYIYIDIDMYTYICIYVYIYIYMYMFLAYIFPNQSTVGVLNSFKDYRHSEDCCRVPGLPLSPFMWVALPGCCASPPLVSLRFPLSPVVSTVSLTCLDCLGSSVV